MHLSSEETAALRKAGTPITEEVTTVEVAYTGDTLIDGLDQHPTFYESELLILECSFLDRDVSFTRERGHVHIDEIVSRLREGMFVNNKNVLLTHFSKRYTRDEILRTIDAKVPAEWRDKIHVLANT